MNPVTQVMRRLLPVFTLLPIAAALVGCGVGTVTQTLPGKLNIEGRVHGGMQPVSGATIELMSVGVNGNGSLAKNILTEPVVTGANSYFSISGDYTCTSATEQVYLVARGGNPGFAGNVDNQALVLLSALGSCDALIGNPNAFVYVNEVSTVAAVYALAPFMSAWDHVGASATNITGINNAFLNAQLLANTADGQAASLAANLKIEQSKLYALADAIAPCVNSTGGGACNPLFSVATPAGGTAPTDVVGALLNIIKNPGNKVAQVYDLIPPTPPYASSLTKAPNDWTMSLTVSGGGLYEPTALAVDKSGNVWVTNFGGPSPGGNYPLGVVAYSPQGTPFNGTPFAPALQTEVYGLTLDLDGNVWVTSEEDVSHNNTYGSVIKLAGANSITPGALMGQFYDSTIDFPESIATDSSNGNIIIGNYAGSTATIYNSNGGLVNNVGAYNSAFPDDVTSDGAGGVWLADQGDYTITHVAADGTIQRPLCCSEANTVALDPQGNVWVTNFGLVDNQYTFSEVSSTGQVLIKSQYVDGLSTPGGAAVDAGGQFWVLNYHSGSLVGIAGNSTTVPVGTALSPHPLGLDADMIEPYSVAPDPSGNLWVSNRALNNVVMFFGLATPTATPLAGRPVAP